MTLLQQMEPMNDARRDFQVRSLKDNVPDVRSELTKSGADMFADAGAYFGPALRARMREPI